MGRGADVVQVLAVAHQEFQAGFGGFGAQAVQVLHVLDGGGGLGGLGGFVQGHAGGFDVQGKHALGGFKGNAGEFAGGVDGGLGEFAELLVADVQVGHVLLLDRLVWGSILVGIRAPHPI